MTAVEGISQPGVVANAAKAANRYLRNVDVWGGRVLFGNTTPALNNLSGLWARNRPSIWASKRRRSKNARAFWRGGIACLGRLFDSQTFQDVARQAAAMVEDDRYSSPFSDRPATVSRIAGHYYCRKLHDPRVLSALDGLFTSGRMETIEDHYGGFFRIVTAEMYRTYHVEPHIHSQVDANAYWWHCDQRPTDIVKLFINLSDVTAHDGPFMAATRPMTAQLLRQPVFAARHEFPFEPMEEDIKAGRIIAAVGAPGTAMLCNTQECLHRAGVPEPGHHRDLLQLVITPSTKRQAEGWLKQIDPAFGKVSRYKRP